MEKFVVSDTNIFIDLINVGILDMFFQLPWEIHTTDMVISEFKNEEQKRTVLGYKKLVIKQYDSEELRELVNFNNLYNAVSIYDCSVWLYARKNSYVLLSGDGHLRKLAITDGVEVRGTIYVIEQLVNNAIITASDAADALEKLKRSNNRQPLNEIDERIKQLRSESLKNGGL